MGIAYIYETAGHRDPKRWSDFRYPFSFAIQSNWIDPVPLPGISDSGYERCCNCIFTIE